MVLVVAWLVSAVAIVPLASRFIPFTVEQYLLGLAGVILVVFAARIMETAKWEIVQKTNNT